MPMLSTVLTKQNLTVLLLLGAGVVFPTPSPVFAQDHAASSDLHSANIDLNGDGKTEKIRITAERQKRGAFFLSVNGSKFPKALYTYDDTTPGFRIVKIDGANKARQIALSIPGPDDNGNTLFYRWDGKAIRLIGDIPDAENVSGNRIVYGGAWMEFWRCQYKYAFDTKTQTLRFVPQPAYHVNVPATVKESFPLLQSHTQGSHTITEIAAGSKIRLVSFWGSTERPADSPRENRWFLIKNAQGVSGWAKFSSFVEKVDGLPYAG